MTKIAAFDVLETSDFVDELLALEPTDPVSVNLESLGFETQWFINNVGSFFIYLLLCFAGVVLFLLVFAFNLATGCASRLRSKIKDMIFWNKLNQAIFESILVVSICCFISLRYNFTIESRGEQIQTWTAVACAVFYITIPLCTIVTLLKNFANVRSLAMVNRLGHLY